MHKVRTLTAAARTGKNARRRGDREPANPFLTPLLSSRVIAVDWQALPRPTLAGGALARGGGARIRGREAIARTAMTIRNQRRCVCPVAMP